MRSQFAQISRDSFLLILATSFALLVAIVTTYLVVPTFKSWQAVSLTYQELKVSSNNSLGLKQQLTALRTELKNLDTTLAQQQIGESKRRYETRIIGAIESLAWRNDLEIRQVSPLPSSSLERYTEARIQVELRGHYFDLYRLLSELKQNLEQVVVNDLIVTNTGAQDRLTIDMTIVSLHKEDL